MRIEYDLFVSRIRIIIWEKSWIAFRQAMYSFTQAILLFEVSEKKLKNLMKSWVSLLQFKTTTKSLQCPNKTLKINLKINLGKLPHRHKIVIAGNHELT